MKEHSTFNIQHSTPKVVDNPLSLDVRRSMLNVECFPTLQNWLLLNSGRCDAAFNMALDEALLENISRLGQPALQAETQKGAARFAAGKGRGGDFGNI